ncbi:tRNA uridine-5-carboxymethylaminomethyl(34) synthesis GTPase MnmE [Chamaesiphon sp. GL140_3_metabinner_50]|uniref:tRNA uridine-5-carboxymethylaminomethyl(34) synthesis GTPase MnmE n=1 Tax=Chamaesiphon sp. GL140_3_metabinner_50 TaxID=2970812 RepID=UPI0025E82A53|nr:tRNA uridine-5-carboxymethylaminomethyl(34) synthesis GTPase MnmE [Chamaesiphon sp. GL140_3_metabinner_50]
MQTGTIVAIATAVVPQQGSVGIVRLSGVDAVAIARQIFSTPGHQEWDSHRILYGYVRHPQTGATIDEALLLLMLAPRSYTREDVVEIHSHGGIILVQQILQLCVESGAKVAEPGEFTLRAFLNGRIDLTQAESISDLVGALSPAAAQTAIAGLQGKLRQPIGKLRSQALDLLAEIEARIDFEEDLPPLDIDDVTAKLTALAVEIGQIVATADRGELLRSGLKVAILGQPNVGKSSLLNAWSKSDRAIVTPLPGTTRDVVESQLVVGGIPIQVLDTAGIRDTEDVVEQIGVARSRAAARSADLVLLTIDAQVGWTAVEAEIYAQIEQISTIVVVNKIDLVKTAPTLDLPAKIGAVVETAAAIDLGIDRLEAAILDIIAQGKLTAANIDIAINQRQAAALIRAQTAFKQVLTTIADRLPLDFWTIDLRDGIRALGEVTGEEVTESVLDRIFSRFCIGK